MALRRQAERADRGPTEDRRATERTLADLVAALNAPDPAARRWAARDLGACGEGAPALLEALEREPLREVRSAMLDSLGRIGDETVVEGLLAHLRSEDVFLRNGAIEVLSGLPDGVSRHILALLNDPDPDVRIFAVDILQTLPHADTPRWLLSVLKDEQHVNVVAAAVDRLAEVGEPGMAEALGAVRERFSGEPYIAFAVDTALRRIEGR